MCFPYGRYNKAPAPLCGRSGGFVCLDSEKRKRRKRRTDIYRTPCGGTAEKKENKGGALLHVLQCGEVFLAGADLDHAGHVADEVLAVADAAGV